ncbi:hypothetical protein FEM08_12430 [Flavobacterium gilvum]|nr:hypothetical protein FEM08_12430 [Flavobacterium gilvum]
MRPIILSSISFFNKIILTARIAKNSFIYKAQGTQSFALIAVYKQSGENLCEPCGK